MQFQEGDSQGCYFLPSSKGVSTCNKLQQTRHARRESTVKLLNLKNSGGRVLISLFARKIINPWDRVREGGTRCEKNGRCDEEKTAGGAVCIRLKGRWADSDMTPRLLSSTMEGGTNVSPASLESFVNAMFTEWKGKGHTSK